MKSMIAHVWLMTTMGALVAALVFVAPIGTASSADKPAEKPAATEKEPKEKTKKQKPGQSAAKGRIKEGASKASGAGIVAKSTACFGQAPKIEKINPDEVKPGEKVTIVGSDFGARGCLSSISFGPGNVAKFEQKDESVVTATVPSLKKKGIVLLTVTTASGEDSKPVFIK